MSEELPIWFVSNSPVADENLCEMYRFLGYHAGPGGTGLRLAGKSLPLVTGSMVHEALAKVVEQRISAPGDALTQVVVETRLSYLAEVAGAGFASVEGDQKRVIEEQQALVEGLVRGWVRTAAADFFTRFVVLAVEREMPIEIPWRHGAARLVRGEKPDVVVKDRQTGNVFVVNWKTLASMMYLKGHGSSPQTMLECVGAERHLGIKVNGFIIYGLVKGSRKPSKLPSDKPREYSGPVEQQSDLCYAYVRQEIPGFQKFGIESGYYQVIDGKNRKRGLEWKWLPVWEHTSVQEWVEAMPQATLNEMFVENGPYFLDTYKVEQALRGIAGSELRWVERLHEAYEAEARLGWGSAEFQAILDGLFKRDYSKCEDMFWRDCPMRLLCEKRLGWQELLGFRSRDPHYEAEKRIQEEQG